MLHALPDGSFQEKKLKYLLRLLVEGIGERKTPKRKTRSKRVNKPKLKTASRRPP